MQNTHRPQILEKQDLSRLLVLLKSDGFKVIGPRVREGAIVYDEIASESDLPVGWIDQQEEGQYKLNKTDSRAFFGYTTAVQSWKRFLNPARHLLFRSRKKNGSFEVSRDDDSARYAFVGVRACELAAIAVQDRVFLSGPYLDPVYAAARKATLIIAVNCTRAGGTCFCASMKSGPKVTSGFDLALTELGEPDCFLVEPGTQAGEDILSKLPHRRAKDDEIRRANELVQAAAQQMGRTLDTEGIQQLLYGNYENRRWDEVASRCLSCANCTMVCPTCFCSSVEDVTDLTGDTAERWRRWDSCFNLDFSYIHGGTIRSTTKSRYRQWLTHKLATWIEQFGTSGCVGCGRCITWCPVGIDLTHEVNEIRHSRQSTSAISKE